MKDIVISLLLAIVLIVLFSVFGSREGSQTTITGFGTQYSSQAEYAVQGKGNEPVQIYTAEQMQEIEEKERQQESTVEDHKEAERAESDDVQQQERCTGWGYDMNRAFLYGVAMTLLFEIIGIAAARLYFNRGCDK